MAKNRIKRIMRFALTIMLAVMLSGCIPAATKDPQQSAPKTPAQTEEAKDPSQAVTDPKDEDLPELSLTRTPGKAPGDEDKKPRDTDTEAPEDEEKNLQEISPEDPEEEKKEESSDGEEKSSEEESKKSSEEGVEPEEDNKDTSKEDKKSKEEDKLESITEDGIYHDLESVVLYYDKFGHLPSNFVTKKEAKDLGWEGGKLDPYVKGGSIGGDHFGNYEKRLPAGKGIKYIECDIDTDGGKRGSKRLIISNKGRYYYTADHYDTFREVVVENGNVTFAD